MPKYVVGDYQEVERLSEPIPSGVYEVEVHSGEPRTSESGTQMFAWQLKVVNDQNPDFNGATLFYNTPLEGKGRVFLQQLYAGCGLKWEGAEVDLPADLLGRTCSANVNNYVYDGQTRAGVKNIIPKV